MLNQARAYRQRILECLPQGSAFAPLMTLYLTDQTSPDTVREASEAGIHAFKLYPAGATTNSDSGVTNIRKCDAALAAMTQVLPHSSARCCWPPMAMSKHASDEQAGMPLLVHGEVTDPAVDFFDREGAFIDRVLRPLRERLPDLKIVMEHITTRDAVDFVSAAGPNTAATITPQHILYSRNALFLVGRSACKLLDGQHLPGHETKHAWILQGGLRPHMFCLPILKREEHRRAVLAAAVSGSPRFFLGTDSAPHPLHAKVRAAEILVSHLKADKR